MSRAMFCRVTPNGQIIAVMPNIKNMLHIFDPTTFPTAKSPIPRIAADIDTNNSGNDVPMPTMAIPMMKSEIFARRAMAMAASTRKLAPASSNASPAISSIMVVIVKAV